MPAAYASWRSEFPPKCFPSIKTLGTVFCWLKNQCRDKWLEKLGFVMFKNCRCRFIFCSKILKHTYLARNIKQSLLEARPRWQGIVHLVDIVDQDIGALEFVFPEESLGLVAVRTPIFEYPRFKDNQNKRMLIDYTCGSIPNGIHQEDLWSSTLTNFWHKRRPEKRETTQEQASIVRHDEIKGITL